MAGFPCTLICLLILAIDTEGLGVQFLRDGKQIKQTQRLGISSLENLPFEEVRYFQDRPIQIFSSNKTSNKTSHCTCVHYDCGCCEDVQLNSIHLDDRVCVNITYLPEEIGLGLSISVGNHTVELDVVSAENPPPICEEMPHLSAYASLCIRFYNLSFHHNNTANINSSSIVGKALQSDQEFSDIANLHIRAAYKLQNAVILTEPGRLNYTFSGCTDVVVLLFRKPFAVIKLGCFEIEL